MPGRRDATRPAGLTSGPFPPLAGADGTYDRANDLIANFCLALALAIVAMVAAQFVRAWLAGIL